LFSHSTTVSSPLQVSHKIKQQLEDKIRSIANQPEIFAQSELDFSRNRKLSFETTLKIILSLGGQSLASELLTHFNFTLQTPTVSAFVQARNKIKLQAFEQLFYSTVPNEKQPKTFKGYRILAHDGSDINIPYDEEDIESHHIGGNKGKCVSILHLNALYDPLTKQYIAVDIQKKKKVNERQSLCQMVDNFNFHQPTIILADRGYEAFNVYEHINKSGQNFLIRVKDMTSNGFLKGLDLPSTETFDTKVNLLLTRRQTNKIKADAQYHFLPKSSKFDYLPPKSRESYPLTLRVVRIKLDENNYEALITNLDPFTFPSEVLKELYHLRWGIETSFRELKYSLGLNHLHSKKQSFIIQEMYARLIMYNFSMKIALAVSVSSGSYQINFTQAIGICKKFFRFAYVDVEGLISRYILPVRPNRRDGRKLVHKGFSGFLYRIA
jgi:hypothetical protein